ATGMNTWIAIVAALAGAIVGGGIAFLNSFFQLRHQRVRERNRLLLSKLEEIHRVLSQFRDAYKDSMHERLLTAAGASKAEPPTKVPMETLQMLVGFYAPQLTD